LSVHDTVLPDAIPVLIAGGGPVGLATALELAHHGVPSLVIERREHLSWLRPRAKTTSARTMEHFRRWGVADAIRERAPLPVAWSDTALFCTSLLGPEITRFAGCFGLDLAGSDLAAEPGQQIPQPAVESVLRQAVRESGLAELRTGLAVTAIEQEAGGVVVEVVDDSGQAWRVRAEYVVGCEGARSVARNALGARYQGSDSSRPNFNVVFRSPTLAALVPHDPAVHYWILNPTQPGLIGRLDLQDTWWCIAQGVDQEAGEAEPEKLVHNLIGSTVPVEVLGTDAWRARMLLVDSYGSGRIYLAGDSAHQNPPWGGHGFNTGIGDAVNLGWKLAAVINGWAPSTLLASYEQERRPIAARTISEATRNMSTLAPELADPRLEGSAQDFHEARPDVAAAVQATKASEFYSLPLVLGYRYQDSPIVSGDGPDQVGDEETESAKFRPSAAPGARLPHRWLGPGDSLYDHLGPEFTLIGDLSCPAYGRLANAARARGVPLATLELRGSLWRDHLGAALALIRPDQHVAWRGSDTRDPAGVIRRAIGYPIPSSS
jgi:2-polyprenyl-6-methoxyphenol hydroxylase-like FAD-dependent oxidoreductase